MIATTRGAGAMGAKEVRIMAETTARGEVVATMAGAMTLMTGAAMDKGAAAATITRS
jgi:hypothetical protein